MGATDPFCIVTPPFPSTCSICLHYHALLYLYQSWDKGERGGRSRNKDWHCGRVTAHGDGVWHNWLHVIRFHAQPLPLRVSPFIPAPFTLCRLYRPSAYYVAKAALIFLFNALNAVVCMRRFECVVQITTLCALCKLQFASNLCFSFCDGWERLGEHKNAHDKACMGHEEMMGKIGTASNNTRRNIEPVKRSEVLRQGQSALVVHWSRACYARSKMWFSCFLLHGGWARLSD